MNLHRGSSRQGKTREASGSQKQVQVFQRIFSFLEETVGRRMRHLDFEKKKNRPHTVFIKHPKKGILAVISVAWNGKIFVTHGHHKQKVFSKWFPAVDCTAKILGMVA